MSPAVHTWAVKHRISATALHELGALFGVHGGHLMPPEAKGGVSEDAVSTQVALEASRKGVRLFRNNVGALKDKHGRVVRYGLANDSETLNKVLKSADRIGFRPTLITPEHVGTLMAQFISREMKPVGWHYTGADREPAQLAWAELVTYGGGDACFCTGVGTL